MTKLKYTIALLPQLIVGHSTVSSVYASDDTLFYDNKKEVSSATLTDSCREYDPLSGTTTESPHSSQPRKRPFSDLVTAAEVYKADCKDSNLQEELKIAHIAQKRHKKTHEFTDLSGASASAALMAFAQENLSLHLTEEEIQYCANAHDTDENRYYFDRSVAALAGGLLGGRVPGTTFSQLLAYDGAIAKATILLMHAHLFYHEDTCVLEDKNFLRQIEKMYPNQVFKLCQHLLRESPNLCAMVFKDSKGHTQSFTPTFEEGYLAYIQLATTQLDFGKKTFFAFEADRPLTWLSATAEKKFWPLLREDQLDTYEAADDSRLKLLLNIAYKIDPDISGLLNKHHASLTCTQDTTIHASLLEDLIAAYRTNYERLPCKSFYNFVYKMTAVTQDKLMRLAAPIAKNDHLRDLY